MLSSQELNVGMTYAKRTATAPATAATAKEDLMVEAAPVNWGADGPVGRVELPDETPVPAGEPVPAGAEGAAGVETGVTVTVL